MTYIPQKTIDEMSAPHGKGERHAAMFRIAIPLLGNGLPASAVFATLREKFPDADKTDKEIQDVISWCIEKNPLPSGYQNGNSSPLGASPARFYRPAISQPPKPPPKPPAEHAEWWLGGLQVKLDDFKTQSQLTIPSDPKAALILFLEMLYLGTDEINIVCKHIESEGKARPCGGGQTLSRDGWLEYLRTHAIPMSNAGAWVRPNPCQQKGSGKDGSIMDSDVTKFKFLLVESDVLPLPVQLALFSKLKLPVAAVITSGGLSAHAWIHMDSKDASEYTEQTRRILTALAPFGIDQANKNPSRLSRLPGAVRKIGQSGDGRQSLLWLNPGKPAITEAGITAFEESLKIPAIQEKPFRKIIHDSVSRYEELAQNGNRDVIPTGLAEFDHDNAGLRKKSMTIIAAETNGGKTSVALNILYNVLLAGHGAALFTLEMDREEIADIFFSRHCQVERNNFNTGRFTEGEMSRMVGRINDLAQLPLYLYDDSRYTVEQIRSTVLLLVSEGLIKFLVVDYAQIVTPSNDRDSREQQIAKVAQELRMLAKDADIPLLVLSQLNDEGRVRESRVIGHEAHNVCFIENHEDEKKMLLIVKKGRRIQKKTYELYYEPKFCMITSAAKISDADVPQL